MSKRHPIGFIYLIVINLYIHTRNSSAHRFIYWFFQIFFSRDFLKIPRTRVSIDAFCEMCYAVGVFVTGMRAL